MNQKIDSAMERSSHKEEFTPGFLTSLILLTLAILLVIVFAEHAKQAKWTYGEFKHTIKAPTLFTLLPAMFASGKTISNGLDAFNGKESAPTYLALEIGTLVSIIISCIIIPTTFFFHWRKRRIGNKQSLTSTQLNSSGVIYALSSILMVSVALVSISSAIVGNIKVQDYERQLAKDKMIQDISLITLDIYQYMWLPKEIGGGDGTYAGFTIAPEKAKTQNGIYTAVSSNDQVIIQGQSSQFSSGIIRMTISNSAANPEQIQNWSFEGVFK